MRSVPRSPEPVFFAELRATYAGWDDLNGQDRRRIRAELIQDFGEICAYCQQRCRPPRPSGLERPNDESVDHFRPRSRSQFQNLWLDWPNLIYSCRLCNQNKGNKWPGIGDTYDEISNRILSTEDSRYVHASEYINPTEFVGQRPAQQFFDFDIDTGKIVPSDQLTHEEWSLARRTIWDLDLNSNYLCNLRLERLAWFIERLDTINEFEGKLDVMLRLMLPRMPFSRFIRAYVTRRFPLLNQFIQ